MIDAGSTKSNARRATHDDRAVLLTTVVTAFTTEPAVNFFFGADYEQFAPDFFGFLFDTRMEGGEVWVVDDDNSSVVAASMWNTPMSPDAPSEYRRERWRALERRLPQRVRSRLDLYNALLHEHEPRTAHFYLGVLATDPLRRSRGHASAVIQPVLSQADEQGLDTFCETGTENNVAFYAKHDFEVSAIIALPDGPNVWWLHRPPKRIAA